MTRRSSEARIFLVDDDDTFRRVMSSELARRGYSVETAASGHQALDLIATLEVDVVLLDLRLPDLDGIEVLEAMRRKNPTREVIVLTGHGTVDTALKAVRLGAYDFLEKPCPMDQVDITIQKAFEHLELINRQRVLEDGYAAPDVQGEFVGSSPAFTRMTDTIARVAATDATVMILGETGVGKEMVAALLHAQGRRRDRPFVVVDCTSLQESILQSELFGHERGAFTGAMRQKHGLFEVADGGTLFLDEVGEIPPDLQSKLLRALETGRFRRLGGTQEVGVDVRILAATNRNLQHEIARGRFREDLFFRLTTLTLEVPPLRERRADIPLLLEHFTQCFRSRFSRTCTFAPEAVEALTRYSWPGNVRELIHLVEQAIVLVPGDVVGLADLPARTRVAGQAAEPLAKRDAGPGDEEPELLSLAEMKRRHVLAVIERTGGHRARAARILEISERNLYRLLLQYGWSRGAPGDPPDISSTS